MAKDTLRKVLLSSAVVLLWVAAVVTSEVHGATSVRDIKIATKYAEARGIFNLVVPATPFLHTGDCSGAFYMKQKAILVSCGKGTSLDRLLSVYLHELGHSEQVLLDNRTPEQAYEREVDAWNKGELLGRELKVWNSIDKFEWELIKQIGLHSYRRRFQPTWNFIE